MMNTKYNVTARCSPVWSAFSLDAIQHRSTEKRLSISCSVEYLNDFHVCFHAKYTTYCENVCANVPSSNILYSNEHSGRAFPSTLKLFYTHQMCQREWSAAHESISKIARHTHNLWDLMFEWLLNHLKCL